MTLEWKRSVIPHLVFRNVLIQKMGHGTTAPLPSPSGGGKLLSVIGSWWQVTHGSVSLTPPGRPSDLRAHLENLLFKHSQAHRGERQKAAIVTSKALGTAVGFVNRDPIQTGVETIAKTLPDRSNAPPWSLTPPPLLTPKTKTSAEESTD